MSNESEKTKIPFAVVLDEYGSYFGNPSDTLRRELREVPGVPNATYLVRDGKVFVFEKLLKFVELNERSARINGQLQHDVVLSLMSDSWVSALEAVTSWSIIPVPYQVTTEQIIHAPFKAAIPAGQDGQTSAQTLAQLLVGAIVEGPGDFLYKGQPMSLIERLDLTDLPPRPGLESPFNRDPEVRIFRRLASQKYIEGFEPITPELFDQVVGAELAWTHDSAQAKAVAYAHAPELWARSTSIPFGILNDAADEIPDHDLENGQELTGLYPELEMLSPGTLYDLFSTFQNDCYYMRSWTADRDDGFLFFLLGRLAAPRADAYEARGIGETLGFMLLRGDDWEDAKERTTEWKNYDTALYSLTNRVANALSFLEKSNAATDLRGGEITTMTDLLNGGRQWKVEPMIVTQSLGDFKPN